MAACDQDGAERKDDDAEKDQPSAIDDGGQRVGKESGEVVFEDEVYADEFPKFVAIGVFEQGYGKDGSEGEDSGENQERNEDGVDPGVAGADIDAQQQCQEKREECKAVSGLGGEKAEKTGCDEGEAAAVLDERPHQAEAAKKQSRQEEHVFIQRCGGEPNGERECLCDGGARSCKAKNPPCFRLGMIEEPLKRLVWQHDAVDGEGEQIGNAGSGGGAKKNQAIEGLNGEMGPCDRNERPAEKRRQGLVWKGRGNDSQPYGCLCRRLTQERPKVSRQGEMEDRQQEKGESDPSIDAANGDMRIRKRIQIELLGRNIFLCHG